MLMLMLMMMVMLVLMMIMMMVLIKESIWRLVTRIDWASRLRRWATTAWFGSRVASCVKATATSASWAAWLATGFQLSTAPGTAAAAAAPRPAQGFSLSSAPGTAAAAAAAAQ